METDPNPAPDSESDSALHELAVIVNAILAQRDTFQSRARAWMSSPAFKQVYEETHHGLIFKMLATLLGAGKSVKMRSSKLWADYQRLATEGELLFAGSVIANAAMPSRPYQRFPAGVVASRNQDMESLMRTAILGLELGELHGGERNDGMPQCQRLLADEGYQPFRRRPLPASEVGGLDASLFDVRFSAAEIILDEGAAYPFIPVLVSPAGGPFIVVPWAILHGRPMPSPSAGTPGPPASSSPEVSPGGSTMIRHKAPAADGFVPADMSGETSALVEAHLERHIGKAENVFHELISHYVHIDVHFIPPGPERLHYTLVTSGMSDLPMSAPPGAEDFRYAELMLCLPADWDLGKRHESGPKTSDEMFKDERSYWPVRWLKQLARFPHEYKTWLYLAHTIPNGNPPEPLAEGSPFTGFMLCEPVISPAEFRRLDVSPDKTVHFHALIPLTTAEMNFKLEHGSDALLEKLKANGVTELVDPYRKSVV